MQQNQIRLSRARVALEGLSVGDALGGFFEGSSPASVQRRLAAAPLPGGPWHYTDDTNMALSIFSVLRQYGTIDQEALAASFAERYDRRRGYGMAMHGHLRRIREGMPWRETAYGLFNGTGSFGNGGGMRAAPLGAYFADDLAAVVEQAHRATEVTHAHPEGIAGGIAVAVAAAVAWQAREAEERPARSAFIERVLPHVPESAVRQGIEQARDLPEDATLEQAVHTLGNGSQVIAQDTMPFVLWCAGERLDDYEGAIRLTLSGGGDTDTTAAMVGGIVATYTGVEAIPQAWRDAREPLPDWPFQEQ